MMHPLLDSESNHFSYLAMIFIIGPQVLNRLSTTCLFQSSLIGKELYNFVFGMEEVLLSQGESPIHTSYALLRNGQ